MAVMVCFICVFTHMMSLRKITTRDFLSSKFGVGIIYGKMKAHTYINSCIAFMSGCEICEGITCICCSGNWTFFCLNILWEEKSRWCICCW